jgi:hypothetical protein
MKVTIFFFRTLKEYIAKGIIVTIETDGCHETRSVNKPPGSENLKVNKVQGNRRRDHRSDLKR